MEVRRESGLRVKQQCSVSRHTFSKACLQAAAVSVIAISFRPVGRGGECDGGGRGDGRKEKEVARRIKTAL